MRYFAGIDMAARSSQVCIIDDEQSVVLNVKRPNHLAEIEALIQPYLGQISIVVEASFNWYWLVDGLSALGYSVTLAHPARLKAITDAKVKTDRRDALWLARLLRGGLIPESHVCPLDQRRVRDLCRLRWRLAQQRGTSLRRSRQTLANEGLHTITRQAIRTMDVLACDIDPDAQAICALHQATQDAVDIQLESLDAYIVSRLEALPMLREAIQSARAIPGVGVVNAATIVLESGDISRFHNQRCYASYCRLAPGIAQSGESTKRGRRDREGNGHLKRAFTNAAMVAGRHSDAIRRFRDAHRSRRAGQSGVNVIVNTIVAHKLAIAFYQMRTTQTPWNEELPFPNR